MRGVADMRRWCQSRCDAVPDARSYPYRPRAWLEVVLFGRLGMSTGRGHRVTEKLLADTHAQISAISGPHADAHSAYRPESTPLVAGTVAARREMQRRERTPS